ncbi:hypothetical protein [Baekduia sp.]|uniref:hypothetical protein n=1 Tax=Baekduia sp. TaxID=2600305 RepID=UPI002D1FA6A3|nr:hypothetical protein [Baekduia sp.]
MTPAPHKSIAKGVSGYRFVKPPLIVRQDLSDQASDVTVYFRMNRRLPKGSYGEVVSQPPATRKAVWFLPKSERCYMQYAGGTKHSPWSGVPLGTPATLALHIHGVSQTLQAVSPLIAPLPVQRNPKGLGDEGLAHEHRLHCLRERRAR